MSLSKPNTPLPQYEKQTLIESFLVEATKQDILSVAQEAIVNYLSNTSEHDEKLTEYELVDLSSWELQDELEYLKDDEVCYVHLSSRDFSFTSAHKHQDEAWSKYPVYAYIHGGITVSTTPFSCRWDSGVLGFIRTTSKESAEKWINYLNMVLNGQLKRNVITGELVEA